jgi:hypothetical protein
LVIVNEFAEILLPILTELVPAADEMSRAPKRAVPPTIPENVTAPVVPELSVNP